MAVPIDFPEWVRVNVATSDKQLLQKLVRYHGTGSEAGVIRRLIREEGRRLGLASHVVVEPIADLELEPAQ